MFWVYGPEQKIQQILKENNMISEDLKGIEIDLDF